MTPYIGSYGDVVNRAGLSHTSYPPPLPPPTVNLIPPWAVQINKGCHSDVGTLPGQRLRRWPGIVPALPRLYVLSTFFSLCANHKYLGPHPARSCVSAPPPPLLVCCKTHLSYSQKTRHVTQCRNNVGSASKTVNQC